LWFFFNQFPSFFTVIFTHPSIFEFPNGQPTMSSSRGYSGSRGGSHSYSISRNEESRRPVWTQTNVLEHSPVMLPACGCYLPMKIYIANTYQNQGRRFWKCRNWNIKVSLAIFMFFWYCIMVFCFVLRLSICVLWIVYLFKRL